MTSPADLRTAYESATYVVLDKGKELPVRANAMHRELDKLLEARGAAEAVFITACNPKNQRKSEAENQAALKRLREIVGEEDLDTLPAEHRAPTGSDWPAEKSLLILDLPPADALALAEMFGQYAILWAAFDQPAQLLFTKLAR